MYHRATAFPKSNKEHANLPKKRKRKSLVEQMRKHEEDKVESQKANSRYEVDKAKLD